jgi:DNA invertase Pin-like site-specific DNA recombinase
MPTKLPKAAPPGRLIGYARVSDRGTGHRSTLDELRAAGCAAVLEEHASGADRSRPVLARLLHEIQAGETLVVVRLDCLARCGISVSAGFCGESVRRVSADTGFRSGN